MWTRLVSNENRPKTRRRTAETLSASVFLCCCHLGASLANQSPNESARLLAIRTRPCIWIKDGLKAHSDAFLKNAIWQWSCLSSLRVRPVPTDGVIETYSEHKSPRSSQKSARAGLPSTVCSDWSRIGRKVAQDAGTWPHTALAHCLCLGMVDGAVVCGSPISRQSFSSLESHIPRTHHAVGLLKYTEVTKQARGQNRRRCGLLLYSERRHAGGWAHQAAAVASVHGFPGCRRGWWKPGRGCARRRALRPPVGGVLRRHGATGGVLWRSFGFASENSFDLAVGRCRPWTDALPSTFLGPTIRRCCLRGTAGWDRPEALWRHWGPPVAQPRVRGDRPTRFGSSRFWAISAGSCGPAAPAGLVDFSEVYFSCGLGPASESLQLRAKSAGRARIDLVQVDFRLNVVWSSRPTAPSDGADFWPSQWAAFDGPPMRPIVSVRVAPECAGLTFTSASRRWWVLVTSAEVDIAGVTPETWGSTWVISRLRMMAGDAALVGTGHDRAEASLTQNVGCWGECRDSPPSPRR